MLFNVCNRFSSIAKIKMVMMMMINQSLVLMVTLVFLAHSNVSWWNCVHAEDNLMAPHVTEETAAEDLRVPRVEMLRRYAAVHENGHNNKWQHHNQDRPMQVLTENELNFQTSAFKSQVEYSCGRAVANKRYKDLSLLKEASGFHTQRAKYRPLEIRAPRIIGGDETNPGEFPWIVSIKLNGQPICGGSLISKQWILTAAHCVVGYNPKNLTVRLGAYRIKDLSEQQTVDLQVDMFIVHKQYSMPRPFSNDIALLKMEKPVEYNDFIIPICLPHEDQEITSSSQTLNRIITDNYVEQNRLSDSTATAAASDGIIVSTKMSDKEITTCFKKIEQNYLNSIGLGTTAAAVAPAESTSALPQTADFAPIVHSNSDTSSWLSPSALHFASNKDDSVLSSSSSTGSFINQNELSQQKPPQENPLPPFESINRNRYQTASSFVAAPNSYAQAEQNFDLPSTNNLAPNEDTTSYNNNRYSNYAISWSGRSAGEQSTRQSRVAVERGDGLHLIKLTSLPISKELLHEIQSVSSMPSLNLGWQAGDFGLVANDLIGAASPSNQRERVISSSGSSNIGQSVLFEQSATTTTTTTTTALPPLEENEISVEETPGQYSGLSGIVVGWGWLRENESDEQVGGTIERGHQSVTLQKVRLPILRNNMCESWFQSQSKKITLLPSQFCAGFNVGGKDACRGDSGGPMILEDNSSSGRYKLIGIVSAGIGCARPNLPGLYTRVASFLPWINAQVSRY